MIDVDDLRTTMLEKAAELGVEPLTETQELHVYGLTLDVAQALNGDTRRQAQLVALFKLDVFNVKAEAYLELHKWKAALTAGILKVIASAGSAAIEAAGLALTAAIGVVE